MLSPGVWHEGVPRTPAENLAWRYEIAERCRFPAYQRAAKHICSQDILFYVNTFGWQTNPNKSGSEVGPFVTWGFQDECLLELLSCVETGRDAVIEKSREMGASWLCLWLFEWLWHFKRDKKFLVVSRSEDAVDSPEPDSLFWKIDFIHRHLPDWLMPAGWNPKKHRTSLRFENPETFSYLTGQASTGRAGVGGRATAMFIDEFSQIKEDRLLYGRTADTTKCRIFNGTHTGIGTKFYELCQRDTVKKVRLHWSQHPQKNKGLYRSSKDHNLPEIVDESYPFPPDYPFVTDGTPAGGHEPGLRSPWYDAECIRRDSSRDVAMDLDIDAKGSTSQFFDPLLIRTLRVRYARPPVWVGTLLHDEAGTPRELVEDERGNVHLWRPLTPWGRPPLGLYAAGADISAGTGATPSCLSILDANTGEKVCAVADPFLDAEAFARLVVPLLRFFTDSSETPAKLAWEMQGPGVQFSGEVLRLGFFHFHRRRNEHSLAKKENADAPGWYPSPAAKRKLMEEYRAALKARHFENADDQALAECLDFEYTRDGVEHAGIEGGDDPSGARVNHGDRVVADALAWMMAVDLTGFRGQRKRDRNQPPHGPPDFRSIGGRATLVADNVEGDDW
jgi:hypothetical protein